MKKSHTSELPIAVLVSGSGTNLQALIDQVEAGRLPVSIRVVICNKAKAFAITRAAKHGIETVVLKNKDFASREEHERAVVAALQERKIELVVLAGYMRLLTPYFVDQYKNRIINLHPALCPSFPGTHSIERAFEAGVKVAGVTVHFVDEGEDTGPIILQAALDVDSQMDLVTLEEKIHALEHRLLPQAVRLFAEGKLRLEGRRVIISD